MPIALHVADYVVFGLLLLISAGFGPFYAWKERRRRATSESYFVGNRSLHIIPTSASLFASFWSAIALVGVPLELYTGGAKFYMSSIGQAIGILLAAFVAVPMMYKLRLISSYEYFQLRFRSVFLRKLGTIFNILATACYLAVVTFGPCVALEAVSPIPAWVSIIVTASVTMLYTVLGGIKAVVWVDLIQAVIMFAGVVISTIMGFLSIDGGFTRALELAYDSERLDFFDFNPDLTNNYNFWVMVIPSILATTGVYATSQAAIQRYSALPSLKQATWSIIMLAPQSLLLETLLFFLALAMFAHYADQGCDPLRGKLLSNPNQLTTFYVADILHYPGLMGIWFSAIFSGSLSTMSTGYNSVAACIWEDLLKGPLEPRLTPRQVSAVLKIIPFLLGVLTCSLAIFFNFFLTGSIIKISRATVSVFGAAIYIAFLNGALFPFTNTTGTVVGMFVATFAILFISGGQMWFKLANEQVWLNTTTHNCKAMMQSLVDSGKYIPDEISAKILGSNETVKAVTTAVMLLTASPTGGDLTANNTFALTANSSRFIEPGLLPFVMALPANLSHSSLVDALGSGHAGELPKLSNATVMAEVASSEANATSLDEPEPWEVLPAPLLYLFSISYFTFPILSLSLGVLVAVLISLCSGGIQMAKTVHPRYLIVKNCFYKEELGPQQPRHDAEQQEESAKNSRRPSHEAAEFVAPHSIMFGGESVEDAQAIAMPQPAEYAAVMEQVEQDDEEGSETEDDPSYFHVGRVDAAFEDDPSYVNLDQRSETHNTFENQIYSRLPYDRKQDAAMEMQPLVTHPQGRP